jgi:hypothetical protein
MERGSRRRYAFGMMETTSHSLVRRARLSTAAIALAVAVTAAAIASVFYTAGEKHLADYKLDSPISSTQTGTP